MDQEFDLILDKCLDHLREGNAPDECLRKYPHFAGELAPLLAATGELCALNTFMPSETAKQKGKTRLHKTINELNLKYDTPKQ